MMKIKQSVLNTFNRVGINPENFENVPDEFVTNWISGQSVKTSALVAFVINKIYNISSDYNKGKFEVKTSDFDRLRMFVLSADSNAYMTCLD